jgi:hypothetical protein
MDLQRPGVHRARRLSPGSYCQNERFGMLYQVVLCYPARAVALDGRERAANAHRACCGPEIYCSVVPSARNGLFGRASIEV